MKKKKKEKKILGWLYFNPTQPKRFGLYDWAKAQILLLLFINITLIIISIYKLELISHTFNYINRLI